MKQKYACDELLWGQKKMKDYMIVYDVDESTLVSVVGELVRADWCRLGEGYNGDYNPNDPNDRELLRLDIYRKEDEEWVPVDDASYCTLVEVNTEKSRLAKLLLNAYKRYAKILENNPYASVKRLEEDFSWMS